MAYKIGDIFDFHIQHLDPFAQGVHKDEKGVVFINKTLAGEKGKAKILKKSKGVYFAGLISIDQTSEKREQADCPHFHECQGCHYLHTSYSEELELKKTALSHNLKQLQLPEITVHPHSRRHSYRNRIQWHYDAKEKKIGLINTNEGKEIIPTPDCRLALPEIQESFRDFLQSQWWSQNQVKKNPKGHIEFSLDQKSQKVTTHFNSPYAASGFTQVNQEMNKKAIQLVTRWIKDFIAPGQLIVDLFGGSGNLTSQLTDHEVLVVDSFKPRSDLAQHQTFLKANLFKDDALLSIQKFIKPSKKKVAALIFDPPRSGHKQIASYVEAFRPTVIIAMSCNSSTLARDLKSITGHIVEQVHLLDFFPSTYHMETLALLKREAP